MKYSVITISIALVFPTNSTIRGKEANAQALDLQKYLEDGYDIYSAIPYSTNEVAGISYILRKEIFPERIFKDSKTFEIRAELGEEDCTCSSLPDDDHLVGCPLYKYE